MKTANSPGLSFLFHESGAIGSIEAGGIMIGLSQPSLFSHGGTSIWIRNRSGNGGIMPLTGPGSNSRFEIRDNCYYATGVFGDAEYRSLLQLSDESLSWQWSIRIINRGTEPLLLDLVWVQDVGLRPAAPGPVNEYYISQYIERRIFNDSQYGPVACCRQNSAVEGRNPWLMIASLNGAEKAFTDGMQFYGPGCRESGVPQAIAADTPGGEYAGESSLVALQEKPFTISPSEQHTSRFMATFLHDHPEASSPADLERLHMLVNEFNDKSLDLSDNGNLKTPVTSLFSDTPLLQADDLTESEIDSLFGHERRHAGKENGELHSFFYGDARYVVLRAGERVARRPHGHIMQTPAHLLPDEGIVSLTAYASGIFCSHLTQGNTNFNTLLSVSTSPFNLDPERGMRIFVTISGKRFLLGVPSAFETGLNHCRWIYKYDGHCFEVRTWTAARSPRAHTSFRVISGDEVSLILTGDLDGLNGWNISGSDVENEWLALPDPSSMTASRFSRPRYRISLRCQASPAGKNSRRQPGGCDTGGDAPPGEAGKPRLTTDGSLLFSDGRPRSTSLFVVTTPPLSAFTISFTGEVNGEAAILHAGDPSEEFETDTLIAWNGWKELSMNLSLSGGTGDIAAISEIMPWFGLNALIHYLTPYGLEQFSGAAWGTRDVAQGPLDLLLSTGRYDEARALICLIFSNQEESGGWPQWWMFDSYSAIRADSSQTHDDIYYWCMIALTSYITVTGDQGILVERLPYHNAAGSLQPVLTPISEHVERLIRMVTGSFIPGTSLVPFGGGDWNDSLQPVSSTLARRMISSWTVQMSYQAFEGYATVLAVAGEGKRASELKSVAAAIRDDFNRHLVRDGVVAGYGLVEEDGSISLLFHPSDKVTGVKYGILPYDRGIISGIFTREQALTHLELTERHLKGPDGARLLDRPLKYRGGVQKIFRRAESSTFFGREIGLMYMHEHLRYAEALAIMGRAEPFMKAVRQAIPAGYRSVVPQGEPRQANCYYSSSDALFRNRYEAGELYDTIIKGERALMGGWRIYSSGPGIFIGLIIKRLLGLRIEDKMIVIDPVMPRSLDGMKASLLLKGKRVTFIYRLRHQTSGPCEVIVNGVAIPFSREENPYRTGGAIIPLSLLTDQPAEAGTVAEILL